VRILFVTQVMLDRPHGGARHVLAVAREMAKLGTELTLLGPGLEPEVEGIRRIRPPRTLHAGARMEAALAVLAAREASRADYDAAYVRISASSSLVPATLAALGVPVILELNGRILDELRELGRSELAIRTVALALMTVVHLARAVIAVEPKIGRHAEEALGAKNVIVVENGADLERATPGDRSEARKALGLDPRAKILTFVGTLVPELRLDLLLEAHRAMEDVTLLVAGDGPQKSALSGDRSRIVHLGTVPHDKAVLAIRAADACINVRDGDLGMKCFEYAAIGRRFVTFAVEGSERLAALYPGLEAVHLVGERSAAALRAAVERALEAERRLGPLAPEAIASARDGIGWDHTARRIMKVIEACASSS
jgi:glycosyltransferase involved in cell wall biosynthesis